MFSLYCIGEKYVTHVNQYQDMLSQYSIGLYGIVLMEPLKKLTKTVMRNTALFTKQHNKG